MRTLFASRTSPGTGRWTAARFAVAAALAGSVFGMLPARIVHAAEPPADYSFYVRTTDASKLYDKGCNQGTYDASHGNIDSEVVLDFGGQAGNNGGTLMTGGSNTYMSYGTVEHLAEQFAWGYYLCTGSDTTSVLNLGVGTNNSAYYVDSTGGTSWAGVVKAVRSWVSSQGASHQVNVGGADDIEPSWHTYSGTKAWVDAFGSAGGSWYLNYGSADGCPQSTHSNGACNNGWTQDDVWYVSWGATPAFATPEIYYQSQANQWGQIRQWKSMSFDGPMDEHDLATSTFTAAQAWSALEGATGNAYMPYALEIHVVS